MLLILSTLAFTKSKHDGEFGQTVHDQNGNFLNCNFQQDLTRRQCFELIENGDVKSAQACRHSCCNIPQCTIWQHHPKHGCWYGVKQTYRCAARNDSWLGGTKRIFSESPGTNIHTHPSNVGASLSRNQSASIQQKSTDFTCSSDRRFAWAKLATSALQCRAGCEQIGCEVWMWKVGEGCCVIDRQEHPLADISVERELRPGANGTDSIIDALERSDEAGLQKLDDSIEMAPSVSLHTCCPGRWCCASGDRCCPPRPVYGPALFPRIPLMREFEISADKGSHVDSDEALTVNEALAGLIVLCTPVNVTGSRLALGAAPAGVSILDWAEQACEPLRGEGREECLRLVAAAVVRSALQASGAARKVLAYTSAGGDTCTRWRRGRPLAVGDADETAGAAAAERGSPTAGDAAWSGAFGWLTHRHEGAAGWQGLTPRHPQGQASAGRLSPASGAPASGGALPGVYEAQTTQRTRAAAFTSGSATETPGAWWECWTPGCADGFLRPALWCRRAAAALVALLCHSSRAPPGVLTVSQSPGAREPRLPARLRARPQGR